MIVAVGIRSVLPGKEAEWEALWGKMHELARTRPGFRSARLLKSTEHNGKTGLEPALRRPGDAGANASVVHHVQGRTCTGVARGAPGSSGRRGGGAVIAVAAPRAARAGTGSLFVPSYVRP
jgi:hypothetical protein